MTNGRKILDNAQYAMSVLGKLPDYVWFKTAVAWVVSSVTFMFGVDLEREITALVILVVLDFFFAIAEERKNGNPISSAKAVRSAMKLFIYSALIAASHLFEMSVKVVTIIDETMVGFLAATEFLSILEHAAKLGYAIPRRILNIVQRYLNEVNGGSDEQKP